MTSFSQYFWTCRDEIKNVCTILTQPVQGRREWKMGQTKVERICWRSSLCSSEPMDAEDFYGNEHAYSWCQGLRDKTKEKTRKITGFPHALGQCELLYEHSSIEFAVDFGEERKGRCISQVIAKEISLEHSCCRDCYWCCKPDTPPSAPDLLHPLRLQGRWTGRKKHTEKGIIDCCNLSFPKHHFMYSSFYLHIFFWRNCLILCWWNIRFIL